MILSNVLKISQNREKNIFTDLYGKKKDSYFGNLVKQKYDKNHQKYAVY